MSDAPPKSAATNTPGDDVTVRAAAIGVRLDFEAVAQDIVDAVVDVTDFKVATITVREGDRCRRLATAGLEDGRIGMTTPFELWSVLLDDRWLRGTQSYLVPPEAPAQWADVPDIDPSDDPNAWTADHGLVLPLRDYEASIVGFIAVDEPRSGLLPDDATIARLEAFAREAEASFVNARLYSVARRQADTMTQLFDIAKTMATTFDLDQVVPRIITAMTNRFDALEVTVGRIVGDEIELRRKLHDADEVDTLTVLLTGPVEALHTELRRHGSIVINDVSQRPELESWLTPGAEALLAAGIQDEEHRTVTLSVASGRTAAFDHDDVEFLRGLLDITVVAMRNADLYEEVRFAAERDPLTGLRNRRMFWSTVAAMLATAGDDHPVALIVIDIDDFKRLNDHHGHEAGDRALRHVAVRLESGVRETDAVFRIGGEEFVLVMPGTDAQGAVTALERIRSAVGRSRLDLPDVTISAGVAVATSSEATGDDMFADADAALYRAKRAGKNRIELADSVGGGVPANQD
jgi:diguanylate cyclase (GGDEF)-like protein